MAWLMMLFGCCFVAACATAMAKYAARADAFYAEHPSQEPTEQNPYGRPPGPVFRRVSQIVFWAAVAVATVASFGWLLGADFPG